MISPTEALQLPNAKISDSDVDDVRSMLLKLDDHIRKHMTFGGPPPIEVPFRTLSMTAAKVLAIVMKRFKWNVNANLMSENPRFQGAQPMPHHWVMQLAPTIEVYDEVLSGFEISPKPQLM